MNLYPFGQMVREARMLAGLQAKDLAASLRISTQYLSDIEHGRRVAPNDVLLLRVWASRLGLPAMSLLLAALASREPALYGEVQTQCS